MIKCMQYSMAMLKNESNIDNVSQIRMLYLSVIPYSSIPFIKCRDERAKALERQLEQEKARVAVLEAQVQQLRSGKTVKSDVSSMGSEEDNEDPLNSAAQKPVVSGPILRSASSSNLLGSHARSTASQAATTPASHHTERHSITDMVSECLHNPSSMANIRSNLKADNLTPKIQRKFYHKATPPGLPSMQAVASPLARDGVRAKDSSH